jgi:hypothetical protein
MGVPLRGLGANYENNLYSKSATATVGKAQKGDLKDLMN